MLLKRSKNNACFFCFCFKSNQKMSLKVYGASIVFFFHVLSLRKLILMQILKPFLQSSQIWREHLRYRLNFYER